MEIWGAGISRLEESVLTVLIQSTREGVTEKEEKITAKAGSVCLYMPPKSATILYHKDIL